MFFLSQRSPPTTHQQTKFGGSQVGHPPYNSCFLKGFQNTTTTTKVKLKATLAAILHLPGPLDPDLL